MIDVEHKHNNVIMSHNTYVWSVLYQLGILVYTYMEILYPKLPHTSTLQYAVIITRSRKRAG